jgi:hypothetical protein
MIRSRATRSERRILRAAGVGLLATILVAGLAETTQAAGRTVTVGTRAGRTLPTRTLPGRSTSVVGAHPGRTSGVSVGRGGLQVNVGGTRIASPSARHHGAERAGATRVRRHLPRRDHGPPVRPDHRNDALRRLNAIRSERLNQSSLLRTLPYTNLLRRRNDDRHTHDRFRHGVPGGAYGPDVKRDILRHRVHTYLPHHRRYVCPPRGSVIITSPGVYYRSYGTSVYTVPGVTTYEEHRVYVDPDPGADGRTYVDPGPYIDPGPYVPEERIDEVPADHGAAASAEALALLSRGRASEALTAFSRLSQTYRAAGVPKIGVALSLAMLEQFDRAAWAMRRALRLDAAAVDHVPVDEALAERLQRLVLQYRRNDQHAVLAKDATFMLAVLHALLGETDAAHEMIGLAVEVGDTSEAAAAFGQYLEAAHPRQ